MPATAKGMMNDGAPVRLKFLEQIVNATSKMAPSPYSLCEGVSFTGISCHRGVSRLESLAPSGSEPQCPS